MPRRILIALLPVVFCFAAAALAGPATLQTTEPSSNRPASNAPSSTGPSTTGPSSTLPSPKGPATRPAGLPGITTPAQREVDAKVLELTRQSIDLLEKAKYDDARPLLLEALKLDPTHTTNLYNYACLLAQTGKADEAIDNLEKAAENGWTDFVHVVHDPDLKSLRDLPRYKGFLAKKDSYQKQAAEHALAALKKQFGDSYLYDMDAGKKLIFATNTDAETLAELKAWLQKQTASQEEQLFSNKPDEFISVVLPSPADYRKIVRMPGVGGFYNDAAKILIAQRLGQVITHEFTHALHAADLAPLGQEHPIWIVEGLASLFEAAQFEGDKLVPHDNFRLTDLQRAARSRRRGLIPLDQLTKMEQPEFVAKANMAYGESSSVMLYLYEQGKLRKFYDAFKEGYEADKTGQKAIEKVSGKSFAEFEKDWTAWMVKRTPVPGNTGSDGVVIGASLGDANDGLKVDRILPGGPADKAGVHDGDLVVGLDDMQVRDYQSFVPMLIQFKAGQTVNLKIRRDGKYIELPLILGKRSEVVDNVLRHPATRPTTQPATRPSPEPAK